MKKNCPGFQQVKAKCKQTGVKLTTSKLLSWFAVSLTLVSNLFAMEIGNDITHPPLTSGLD